jgi:hypothetical protein
MPAPPARPTPRQRSRRRTGLSVALSTWNGAAWLDDLLNSIAAQARLPDELVVQDDSSTDGTVEMVRRFADTVPFPVHLEVNDVRLGSTANFARALARCRGEFIALADQDDVWYPAKLRRLAGELEEDPTVTLVFSNADLIDEDGNSLGRRLWATRRVDRVLSRHAVVSEELFARRALTTGCTMAVRRRAVDAALPFPDELAAPVAPMRHDRWLSLVAAAVGTVRALPEPLLAFRVHPSQETGVLIGGQLRRALARSAIGVVADPPSVSAAANRARGAQLRAAADRADRLGDFASARTLRRVAAGHEVRGAAAPTRVERVRQIAKAIHDGVYDATALGAGSALADAARALRRPPSGDPLAERAGER